MIKAKDRKQTNRQKAKSRTIRSRTDSGSSSSPRRSRAVTKHGAKKVWHISRFRERYELAEDIRFDRKSPLIYTKDFTGAGLDAESSSYSLQLLELRSKKDFLVLLGSFVTLKSIAANKAKKYRGYLLNSSFEPATDVQISCWLALQNGQTKHVLKELSSVGLIEQITAPDFGRLEGKKKRLKKQQKKKKSEKDKKQTRPKKNVSRARTSQHERAWNALNKKVKAKINGNDKVNSAKYKRQRETKVTKSALEGKEQAKGQGRTATTEVAKRSLTPTTTPPIKPKKADAGSSGVIQFPGSLSSDKRSEPQRLGDILKSNQHRYDPKSKSFGSDIFTALGLTCGPESPEGRRELGCFASLWTKAKQNRSPPELDNLRGRAIAEAARLRKYWHNRPGKIQAVWVKIFNDMIAKVRTAKIVS